MRRASERCFGYPDDRDVPFAMNMRAQARPAIGIKVNVAIDDDQPEVAGCRDDRPQRRQFPEVELARLIGRDDRNCRDPGRGNRCEPPVTCRDHRRPCPALVPVVHVDSDELFRGGRW